MKILYSLLKFPQWYYIEGGVWWYTFVSRTVILGVDATALPQVIKAFFSPYRKDTSFIGRAMGIFIRTFYVIGSVIALIGISGILLFVSVFYLLFPLLGLLLAISVSEYWWINFLGILMLLSPLAGYTIYHTYFDSETFPLTWQETVARRLNVSFDALQDAQKTNTLKQFLNSYQLTLTDYEIVKGWVAHQQWEKQTWRYWENTHFRRRRGVNLAWVAGFMPETKQFVTDVSTIAKESRVYHWVGLSETVSRVLEILSRTQRNAVLLIGDPGVGKTAVIHALAHQTSEMGGRKIVELDLTAMLAGATPEEFQQRLQAATKELAKADVILVIEQAEQLVTAGIAEYFSRILQSGVPVVATTTHKSFREIIEQSENFVSEFETVRLSEPDVADVLFILQERIPHFEEKYGVFVTYQAIKASVSLAERYIRDRALPAKAIDLLEEVCARVQSGRFATEVETNEKTVTNKHVEQLVKEQTGIAVGEVQGDEADMLLRLEQVLHKQIIGQDEAVSQIASAMRRARSGLVSEERPIASFLFLGPTGVGKTLTAKVFAHVYFTDKAKIIPFDMSEYSEFGSVDRFLDRISDEIRASPQVVILFDEFEKADQKIHNLFLQIMEEGRITDTKGNKVDFTNSILIATSNSSSPEKDFRPELRNRFDGIITFSSLKPAEVEQIAEIELQKLVEKMKQKQISVTLSPTLISAIGAKGYDPQLGARPLRRVLQEQVENPLSEALLKENIRAGAHVTLDWEGGQLVIEQ